jgi:hypothetical protein
MPRRGCASWSTARRNWKIGLGGQQCCPPNPIFQRIYEPRRGGSALATKSARSLRNRASDGRWTYIMCPAS